MIEYTRQQLSPARKTAQAAANAIVDRVVTAEITEARETGAQLIVWTKALNTEVTAEVTRILDEMIPDADGRTDRIEHIVNMAYRHATNVAIDA